MINIRSYKSIKMLVVFEYIKKFDGQEEVKRTITGDLPVKGLVGG